MNWDELVQARRTRQGWECPYRRRDGVNCWGGSDPCDVEMPPAGSDPMRLMAARYATQSRFDQGLTCKVTDPWVVARLVSLLAGSKGGRS